MLSLKETFKIRTNSTALTVKEKLAGTSPEELITELFLHTDDPVAKELIKRYEQQLVLSLLDYEQFKKGLHRFFEDTTKFIKKEKLYRKFYEFCYFIFTELVEKKKNACIANAYQDMLIQQTCYFMKEKMVYGISTKGKPFYRNEIYPKLDYPYNEFIKKHGKNANPSFEELQKSLKRYGYNFEKPDEFLSHVLNEQILGNMVYQMTFFIDENYLDMFPFPYYFVTAGIKDLPPMGHSTDFYKKGLKEKRYFLPPRGVKAFFRNAGDIKEVFFREKFVLNRIILLFKTKMLDDRCVAGFFDNKYDHFFTPWHSTSGYDKMHKPLENFILQNYFNLTTNEKAESGLEIVDDINSHNKDNSVVQYISRDEEKAETGKGQARVFNKEDYEVSLRDINPFIRRLPVGARASEEAKKRAKELGYILGEGETFVSPHKKTVYKKD